jgi:hypothetical protein
MSTHPGISNTNADYAYSNIQIDNRSGDTPIPCSYLPTRNFPLLPEVQDWMLSINRFRVPISSLPLLIFENKKYYIGFSLDSTETNPHWSEVVYNPSIVSNDTQITNKNYIMDYHQIISMINIALKSAWSLLINDPEGGIPISVIDIPPILRICNESPYLYFNLPSVSTFDDSGQIINSSLLFRSTDRPNPVNMHVSEELYELLYSFGSIVNTSGLQVTPPINGIFPVLTRKLQFQVDEKNIQLIRSYSISELGRPEIIVPDHYAYLAYSQFGGLHSFSTLRTIVLETSTAVKSEAVSNTNIAGTSQMTNILTDFDISPNADGRLGYYVDFNDLKPRYFNFRKIGELYDVDLSVIAIYKNGQRIQVFVPPREMATIKVQFKRRKAINLLQYTSNINGRFA